MNQHLIIHMIRFKLSLYLPQKFLLILMIVLTISPKRLQQILRKINVNYILIVIIIIVIVVIIIWLNRFTIDFAIFILFFLNFLGCRSQQRHVW